MRFRSSPVGQQVILFGMQIQISYSPVKSEKPLQLTDLAPEQQTHSGGST